MGAETAHSVSELEEDSPDQTVRGGSWFINWRWGPACNQAETPWRHQAAVEVPPGNRSADGGQEA